MEYHIFLKQNVLTAFRRCCAAARVTQASAGYTSLGRPGLVKGRWENLGSAKPESTWRTKEVCDVNATAYRFRRLWTSPPGAEQ